jgi:hypothetical protein
MLLMRLPCGPAAALVGHRQVADGDHGVHLFRARDFRQIPYPASLCVALQAEPVSPAAYDTEVAEEALAATLRKIKPWKGLRPREVHLA